MRTPAATYWNSENKPIQITSQHGTIQAYRNQRHNKNTEKTNNCQSCIYMKHHSLTNNGKIWCSHPANKGAEYPIGQSQEFDRTHCKTTQKEWLARKEKEIREKELKEKKEREREKRRNEKEKREKQRKRQQRRKQPSPSIYWPKKHPLKPKFDNEPEYDDNLEPGDTNGILEVNRI